MEDSDKPVFVGIGPAKDVEPPPRRLDRPDSLDFDLWRFSDTSMKEGDRQPVSLDETLLAAQS